MAARTATSSCDAKNKTKEQTSERLKILYPAVNEEESPLPKHWSPKDKYNFIGLSQNNLRVHYKGVGKTHKDAASVRASGPIPASCGIYYFEVKIISKGRDGYMGIGLSVQGVNLNRLPGWDTHSYGYHGDDGHSFCSSGQGKPYGPTFTTGDVVGCCINLIDNTCFYTKNGVNLGIAFRDLPTNLYPTVGLQTPGEVVEANFGQSPFIFDIEDYMREWRLKTKTTIERFPVVDAQGEWQTALQKIVSTYLVHHGYCATAEAFARSTGQCFDEELMSIKNRQRIQRLVLAGRMGEAIETTRELYPGLLERNPNLLFNLKCRQFIEMVNGTDSQVRGSAIRSPKSHGSSRSSPNMSPIHHSMYSSSVATTTTNTTSTTSTTKPLPSSYTHKQSDTSSSGRVSPGQHSNNDNTNSNSAHIIPPNTTKSQQTVVPSSSSNNQTTSNDTPATVGRSADGSSDLQSISEEEMNNVNSALNNTSSSNGVIGSGKNSTNNSAPVGNNSSSSNNSSSANQQQLPPAHSSSGNKLGSEAHDCDSDMDTSESDSRTLSNGVTNGSCVNGASHGDHAQDIDMEEEAPPHKRQLCGGSQLAIEKMLQFGRELHAMSEQLRKEFGTNESNKNALKDAFSLLAYSDPWSSPVGAQLDPVQREPVCAALNSAILESHGLPKQPPLEIAIGQVSECMQLMSRAGVSSCAFATVTDYLH